MTQPPTLVREAMGEMRRAAESEPGLPLDTDVVWVLSAPGTYLEQATPEKGGIYAREMQDRNSLHMGFAAVTEITAGRLGKNVADVTPQDIELHGPTLYYNGEGTDTANTSFSQNEDLRRAMAEPGFPFPPSKIVIGEIDVANTPAQARDFAGYLNQNPDVSKVAVVSLLTHAPGVSRYIKREIEVGDMPPGVEFYGVPVPVSIDLVGAGVREVRKVVKYYRIGHLARQSAVPEYHKARPESVLNIEERTLESSPQPELTAESRQAIHDLVTRPFDGEEPDVIIALSGGIKPDVSGNNPTGFDTLVYSEKNETGVVVPSKTRVIATAAIADAVPTIPIVTNSVDRSQPDWPTMASVVAAELVSRGVDASRIIQEGTSFNTVTQLIETLRLAVENEWSNVVLVANDWYFPRLGEFVKRLKSIVSYEDPAQQSAFLDTLEQFDKTGGQITMVASEEVMCLANPRFSTLLMVAKAAMNRTIESEARGLKALQSGSYLVSLRVEQ